MDMSTERTRIPEEVRAHAVTFLQFLAEERKVVPISKKLMRDAAALYLGGAWMLEAKACVSGLDAWAQG